MQLLAECDFVIEAVVEDRASKKKSGSMIEDVVGNNVVIATATSTLSVTGLASCSGQLADTEDAINSTTGMRSLGFFVRLPSTAQKECTSPLRMRG